MADKTEKLWQVFAVVLSLAGCLFQVIGISQRYFSYEVMSKVDIARIPMITGPKVIVCLPFNSYDRRYFNRWLYDVLAHEQFLNDSVGQIPKSPIDVQDCKKEGFVKLDNICWSCSPSKQKMDVANPSELIKIFGIMQVGLSNISRTHDKPQLIKWYMHPMDLSFYGHSFSYVNQDIMYNSVSRTCPACHLTLTYTHYETHLSKAPYKTNCLDYGAHGCESRAHCIEKCERSVIKDGCLIKGHLGTIDMPLIATANATLSQMYSFMRLVRSTCETKFRKTDCLSEYYIPREVEVKSRVTGIVMNLLPTGEPEIVTESHSFMDLVDFLVYILSVVSFWLGFCPMTFMMNERVTQWLLRSKKPKNESSHFVRVNRQNTKFNYAKSKMVTKSKDKAKAIVY